MRRIGLGLAGIAMLAACGKAPETQGNAGSATVEIADNMVENAANEVIAAVNATDSGKGGEADQDAVRALIDGLYSSYSTASGPGAGAPVSPDFKAALAQAERQASEGLGYDPWCDCQDFDATKFRYEVRSIQFAPDGDHARATMAINLGFDDTALSRVRKWLDLVRTPKGWLVDDMSNNEGMSLKAQIRAMAPVKADNAAE